MSLNENIYLFEENATLLQELNKLREELKIIRDRIQDYEIARETSEVRGIHSIDALIQTLNADAGLSLSLSD